jgi:antitoxin component YwqK of YwqJK toxin-antitoxin module
MPRFRHLFVTRALLLCLSLLLGCAEFAFAQSTRNRPSQPSGITNANDRQPSLLRRKETHRNGVVKRYFTYYRDNATHRPLMHGYDTHYYNTGRKHMKLTYRHGRKDGKAMGWYANGQAKESGYYKAGEKHAEWQEWNEDGTLVREITYQDGLRHGSYRHYWPSGKLRYQGSYNKGDRHGVFTRWFENNNKESVVEYKNNEEEGVAKYYYDNGQQRSEYVYKNGRFEGEGRTWSIGGKLLALGIYRQDEPWEGTFWEAGPSENTYLVTRYKEGEPEDSILYEDGEPMNGAIVEWHGEQKIRRCQYKDGRKHGEEVRWTPTGAIISQCDWDGGLIHGTYIEYDEISGKETWVVHCKFGLKDGPEWMWDAKGNLIADGMNKAGKPWAGVLMVQDVIEVEEALAGKNDGNSRTVVTDVTRLRTKRTTGQVLKLYESGVPQKIVTDEYFLAAPSERVVQHLGESGTYSKGAARTADGKVFEDPNASAGRPSAPSPNTPTGPNVTRDSEGNVWRTEITPQRR